ncbi:hypothetical protein R3P38DRAFT_475890 [Favolaschia claudopus]|uniref:Uncharacterized protein n=1 Tax=Favolaschia claudopus TaxID=2862362 RepID=A0AAW0CLG1_9AGAR
MSSPKSIRSRMGTVMRRTSSILAMANSRPSTPGTPGPASSSEEVTRRSSSISKTAEGRQSTSSIASAPAQASKAASVHEPEPAPAPQTPQIVAEPLVEPTPAPVPSAEPAAAPEVPADAPQEAPAVSADGPSPPPPVPTPANATPTHKAVKRLLPIAAQYQMYPSPIAESPSREAAEVKADELFQANQASGTAPSTQEVPPPPAPAAEEPAPVPVVDNSIPPPPLVDHGSNPGAFTDEPMDMHPNEYPSPPVTEAPPAPVDAVPAPAPAVIPEPGKEPIAAAPLAPGIDEPGYFDIIPAAKVRHIEHVDGASPETDGSATIMGVDRVSPYPYPQPVDSQAPSVPMPEADHQPAPPVIAEIPDLQEAAPVPQTPVRQPQVQLQPESDPHPYDPFVTREAESHWRGDEGEHGKGWVSDAMFVPVATVQDDPFADPPQSQYNAYAYPPVSVDPARTRTESIDSGVFVSPIALVDGRPTQGGYDVGGGVSSVPMPAPTDGQGLAPGFASIRTVPSAENMSQHGQGRGPFDERQPLLSARMPVPNEDNTTYHRPSHEDYRATATTTGDGDSEPTFRELGWIAYVLPDVSTTYYVHPTLRATTDLDLRDSKMLGRVNKVLGYAGSSAGGSRSRSRRGSGVGMELWLRESDKAKKGKGKKASKSDVAGTKGKGKVNGYVKGKSRSSEDVGLEKWYVDHSKREVSSAEDLVLEDHLDMEYRYWAFMESHPAHAPLPLASRREASDVLTWSWTDRVLPPHQLPIPPPFTQQECQELLTLLRSFEMPQTEVGVQSIVVTRIVSRILLRVVQWRQHYFRPNKALPVDRIGNHPLHHLTRSPGFLRRTADVILTCILLGVPYLFYTRGGYHTTDAEGGTASRSMLPILLIGACTCLLASILLSASVTFLSLPGMHNVARAVAFGVVLLTAGAMASGLVALFRYKAELVVEAARPAMGGGAVPVNSFVGGGGEGLMLISTRSVVMSLPLVLLIYAVMGFVAAIVIYSFLGVDNSSVRFEEYTRWAVLGVLGGLAGILTMSAILLRR